ncbi:MAG: hypothetical protein M1812_000403 [Candelaria pacifica]|nr:MAG: hypothetical protein M1812_000403 [Candelaria pacifica]
MGSPSTSTRRHSIWTATRNLVTTNNDKPVASTRQLKKASKARTSAAWLAQQGELGSTPEPNDTIDASDDLSRSASLTSDTTNPRGSSTLLTSSLGGSRLSLVAESTTSPTHEPKPQASIDGLTASNSTSSSQDAEEPDATLASPVRKRSFFTPGIATRVRSRNTLRKAPPLEHTRSQTDKDYYYNPYFPEISPHSQLADLGASERRGSLYSRTAPPSEPTYSHLAGLRQGTLRITNGAASPVLSLRTEHLDQVAPDVEKEEEFLTASEGRSSEDFESEMALKGLGQREGYPADDSAAVKYHTGKRYRHGPSAMAPFDDETPRCENPRRFESWTQELESDDSDDEPTDTKAKVLMKRRSLSLFEFPAWSNDRASSMAERYMQELPHRPFSRIGPTDTFGLVDLEPSNRRSRDDEGIVIGSYRNSLARDSYSSPPTAMRSEAGTREEALSILEGTAPSRPQSEVRPVMPSRYTWDAAINVADYGTENKHASKADSGYSSKESLNSSQNGSQAAQDDDATGKALPQLPHSTTGSQPVMPRRLAPAVPLQSLANATVIVPGQASKFSAPPKPTKPSVSAAVQVPLEPMTTLAVKETSPSRSPRKLQKPRRLSQSMVESANITVQACKEIQSSQIPVVPSSVAAKHAERLSKFPALGHTFPTLDHTLSEETLSAAALIDVPLRFPSPSDGNHGGDDERAGSQRQQSDKASIRQSQPGDQVQQAKSFRGRSKSRQRSASRHRSASQTAPSPTIADFGTVTESLGPSPYEIAASSVKATSRNSNVQPLTYSHQGSDALPHAKTMTGMDEEAAANFAKERSQSRNRSKAKNFSRPRSVHSEPFDDRGGIPGKLPRPTSLIIFDAPPVPSLPAIERVKQTVGPEDQAARPQKPPRPSSMFAEAPVRAPIDHEARETTYAKWQESNHHSSTNTSQPHASKKTSVAKTTVAHNSESIAPVRQPDTVSKRPTLGSRSRTFAVPEHRNKRLPEPPRISDAEALEVSHDWETAKRAWQQRRKSLAEGLQSTDSAQPVALGPKVESAAERPSKTRYYASNVTVPARENLARTKSSEILATPSAIQSNTPLASVIPSTGRPAQVPTTTSDVSKVAQKDIPRTGSTDVQLRPQPAKPAQRHLPRAESLAHIPFSGSDTLKPAREDVPRTKSADVINSRPRPQSARPAPRAISRTESLTDLSYRGNDISEPTKDYNLRSSTFEPPRTKSPAQGLLNRYGGGLAFNYEPGLGLGGSAGQRNVKSKASRKSIDISMSHGVDLSDIPVFINF